MGSKFLPLRETLKQTSQGKDNLHCIYEVANSEKKKIASLLKFMKALYLKVSVEVEDQKDWK